MEVIRTGKTRWSEEMTDDFLAETTRDEEHLALVKSLGFRSFVAVPLVGEAEVLGSLTLVSAGRPFGPEDVSFAERLAGQVAAVVDNARRYESTLATSHTLQQSLLPQRLPDVPGLEIHTRYLPATRGLEVGGDFYDVVVLPSGRVGFVIGDVAGHDRDAAALMGHLRSSARALAGQVDGPAELIDALQWSWRYLAFDRIATALIGQLDPGTGELVLASAGHYPPLLVRSDRARYLPVVSTVPLGVSGPPAVGWHGTLEPGQVLLLYTDGAIDERGVGPETSMGHLAAALSGHASPNVVRRPRHRAAAGGTQRRRGPARPPTRSLNRSGPGVVRLGRPAGRRTSRRAGRRRP